MAIPIPKSAVPTIDIELPVAKKIISLRAYTAKEEKLLLQTAKVKSESALSILTMLEACSGISRSDIRKLAVNDALFAYIQLVAVSSGATRQVELTCPSCGAKRQAEIDITQVKLDAFVLPEKVEVGEDCYIVPRFPSFNSILPVTKVVSGGQKKEELSEDVEQFNTTVSLLADCIETIVVGEQTISTADVSRQDVINWVESLHPISRAKISAYVETLPVLKLRFAYTCTKCGEQVENTISDLTDFFS